MKRQQTKYALDAEERSGDVANVETTDTRKGDKGKGKRRKSRQQPEKQCLRSRVKNQGCCLAYVVLGLFVILLIVYIVLNSCEGYHGLVRLLCLAGLASVAVCGGYKELRSPKEKWLNRLWGGFFMVVGGAFVLFVATTVALDLFTDSLCVYQGPVKVEVHVRKRGFIANYTIEWEGDGTNWWTRHTISEGTMGEMINHDSARVTYWRHTGVVKKVEPM